MEYVDKVLVAVQPYIDIVQPYVDSAIPVIVENYVGLIVGFFVLYLTYNFFFKKNDRVAYINAIGVANGPHPHSFKRQCDFDCKMGSAKQAEFIRRLAPKMGIEQKHLICEYEEVYGTKEGVDIPALRRHELWKTGIFPLAVKAAENALAKWNGDKKSITHVISHSCTGWTAPGISVHLINALELKSNTQRIECNFMGCFGGFTLMKTAKALVESNPNAVVLCVAAESCTTQRDGLQVPEGVDLQPADKMRILQNMLFADGSGAIIVSSKRETGALELELDGSEIVPGTQETMTWNPHTPNHSLTHYEMTVLRTLPDTLRINFKNMMWRLMTSGYLNFSYAIHPGGKKIVKFCESALRKAGLEPYGIDTAYEVLKENGNMSSCSIYYVLQKLQNLNLPQKRILSVGFGPGLTLEYAVLKRV